MTTRVPEAQSPPVGAALTRAEPPLVAGGRDEVVRATDGGVAIVGRDAVTVASEADRLVLTAATEIVLQVGQSTFTLRADGTILLNGRRMTLTAPAMIDINPEPPGAGADGGAPDAVPAPR